MAFVKEYNEKTASMKGDVIPVEITIFQDKSFTFELKVLRSSTYFKGSKDSKRCFGKWSASGWKNNI